MKKSPKLVVIDIQKEYNTQDRPFEIKGIEKSLAKAKELLDYARESGWNILHVQHLQDEGIFRRGSNLAGFVDGFEPNENETAIEKGNFSCFSSKDFKKEVADLNQELILIGYNSTMCILSTAIEAYHRGYSVTIVSDATDAKAGPRFDSAHTHEVMLDTLSTFAKILSVEETKKTFC